MRRLIVPISFAVMGLAVAAMLPALVSAQTTDREARSCYTFSYNMGVGSSRSEDVTRLSAALNTEGLMTGKTDMFDEEIAAAVVKFQAKYGIPTTGYVGPLTRAKLNSLYGCGSQGSTSSVAAACPPGYVCTPANQVKYTCPPGYVCNPVGSSNITSNNTSTDHIGAVSSTQTATTCPAGFLCQPSGSGRPATEKGRAAYNLFVTLLHRTPDVNIPDWNYFENYSGSIDQMKQEFMSGIEYTTKQKIYAIFQSCGKSAPDDLQLTKWYYVSEYNGYNTEVVRQALGCSSVTMSTPVQATVCPAGFTCNPTTSTPIQPSSKPFIVITSPTGGESYQVGGQIAVRWYSGSISSTQSLDVVRLRSVTTGVEHYLANGVLNDGTESLTLPPLESGKYTLEIKSSVPGVADAVIARSAPFYVGYSSDTSSQSTYPPVAKILIGGQKSYTYNVGDINHYEWMSKFGDSFSSYSKANNPTQCGEGPWVANTDHGTSDTYIGRQWAGCVWTVTYVVKNSSTGKTASDTVVVTINPVEASVTSDAVQPQTSTSNLPY